MDSDRTRSDRGSTPYDGTHLGRLLRLDKILTPSLINLIVLIEIGIMEKQFETDEDKE